MTQISGKLVNKIYEPINEATIELPTVDMSKIKAGEEVWIKSYVVEDPSNGELFYEHSFWVKNNHPIAHFPKKEEPRYPCSKCGKLRTKEEGGTTFTVCDECWEKQEEPKAELPEEVKPLDYDIPNFREYYIACHNSEIEVINQLIKVVKQMQEKIERGK